jgi:hypothetical protein
MAWLDQSHVTSGGCSHARNCTPGWWSSFQAHRHVDIDAFTLSEASAKENGL